jgi:hypothetical protein
MAWLCCCFSSSPTMASSQQRRPSLPTSDDVARDFLRSWSDIRVKSLLELQGVIATLHAKNSDFYKHIKELDLSGCGIKDSDIPALIETLKPFSPLSTVFLRDSVVTGLGVCQLMQNPELHIDSVDFF